MAPLVAPLGSWHRWGQVLHFTLLGSRQSCSVKCKTWTMYSSILSRLFGSMQMPY